MSLLLDSAIRFNTEVALTIEPKALDGVLVHFGQLWCFNIINICLFGDILGFVLFLSNIQQSMNVFTCSVKV